MPELAVVVCRIMVAKDTREDSARALALIARHLIRIKPGDFAELLIVQSKLLITMVRTHSPRLDFRRVFSRTVLV